MNDDALPSIPTPPALRWREFRVRFLPILVFVAALSGVTYIWKFNVSAPILVGAVEGRSAQIASPYAGKIVRLMVDRFQMVKQGTPVAIITANDPRVTLSVIQSELDILRTRFGSDQTEQRLATDYERLRLDWMQQKVDLATATANLQGAKAELRRQEALHNQKLVSDDIYEAALTLAHALEAEITERSNLIRDTEQGLKSLQAMERHPTTSPLPDSLAKAVQQEEDKLQAAVASMEPVTLVAPMDGMVSMVCHQAGENVTDREPLLTIVGSQPERIVAYLRQPISFEPKVGDQVVVRTRNQQRVASLAQINNVGLQFEAITNALAMVRPGGLTDFGLPVEISLPPGLKVRPGELVDLSVVLAN